MSRRPKQRGPQLPAPDFFDLAGSDPELLNSGRIPDPQPGHTPLFRWLARVLTAVEARLRARGDASIRNAIRFAWAAVAAVGLFLLVGPVINEPMSFDDVIASADVDEVDWVARDVRVDYAVDRAADGSFAAQVDEAYTADFRNGPESRVERAVVTEFEGHDVRFELVGATIDGAPAEVEVGRGPTTATIGITRSDGADFTGQQQISLSYKLHDLITTEIDEATGQPVDRWSWPLFAPTWPQATKGIEVLVTLDADVDDALVRAPRATVAWLLVSGTQWLTPEGESSSGVRYAFSNDDSLPPNSDIVVTASFDNGTFVQPPTTTLFWFQTYGPLVPMGVLAVLLVFALAARRVVWADSAGEPWYLPRNEPPDRLTPELAAQLLGVPRHAELIDQLSELPASALRARNDALGRVARAARRAGKWGSALAVARRSAAWQRSDMPVAEGLRWVPDSYVRDFFTVAPVAIAVLQWGLLRQLSHQVILAVVWWPAAFVLVSTALAIASCVAVYRPRPLTRAGALAVQQLRGIDVWARATRLTDRGPIDEPILPHALLFRGPRRAGRAVVALAAQESGDANIARGWRSEGFVSAPAICALAASVALLAGAIVTSATLDAPYDSEVRPVTQTNDLPGTLATAVSGFDIEAELTRGADGQARIDVVEHLDVVFDDSTSKVPQFAREWPTERLGQSLGFGLDAVRIDGEEVAFTELPQPKTRSAVMLTQLQDVLSGTHRVEVSYTLSSAAVAASNGAGTEDEIRWMAWYSFWEDEYYTEPSRPFAGKSPVRPIRLQLTVAPELAEAASRAGWLDQDLDRERVQLERGNVPRPWVTEDRLTPSALPGESRGLPHEIRVGSVRERPDGALVAQIDVDAVESRLVEDDVAGESAGEPAGEWRVDPEFNDALDGFALELTGDLGAMLEFPSGTFAGIDPEVPAQHAWEQTRPYVALLSVLGLVVAASIAIVAFAARLRRRASVSLRVVSAAVVIGAIAQCVLFWWVTQSMAGSDARAGSAVAGGAIMLVAVIAQLVAVVRAGAQTSKPAATTGNGAE